MASRRGRWTCRSSRETVEDQVEYELEVVVSVAVVGVVAEVCDQIRGRCPRDAAFHDRSVSPKIRLHDLRHTHATLGLAAGVDAKVMSDRLGHATSAFTQDIYMHAIPATEEAAADQIAGLVFGVNENADEGAAGQTRSNGDPAQ